MAKIKHNNIIDTINDIVNQARENKVSHLYDDSDQWAGRYIEVDDRKLINFGTCGYLGLEVNQQLIDKSIDLTKRYGTQYSISRALMTSKTNRELEEKLELIFDHHKTIIFSSTSLAHVAVIPIVVDTTDYIILDQQTHVSIQTATQIMASKGVPVDVIRHNNLEMLERKIQQNRDKYSKIWYMIDGVYSMYGDVAPLDELNELAKKYPNLYFYVDDAHGMSWSGKNGAGCVFEKFKTNDKTILATTMAKGFGSLGGIIVFPNEATYNRVIIHGGALSYSHPIAPAVIGASIASADIHLSDEIYKLQDELQGKISYCNELLKDAIFPVLSEPNTPIYFIGTGQPNVGYNFNKRILSEGFYVNIGLFPAVPVKNTGLRFTITNHITKEDIKAFVDALKHHYPKALKDEGKTVNNVRKAFKLPLIEEEKNIPLLKSNIKTTIYRSIIEIEKETWNSFFIDKGNFDWDALFVIEKGFSNNKLPEDNWVFYYILIEDINTNKVVLATFFTAGLFKDDLLSPPSTSKAIEATRITDRYYLCSRTLMLGSLLTEGDLLYLDKNNLLWKEAILKLINTAFELQDTEKANSLILRDFTANEVELENIYYKLGFIKMKMPNSNIIHFKENIKTDYIEELTTRSRRGIRYDVIKYSHNFKSIISNKLSTQELEIVYELYKQTAKANFGINIFNYPFSFFEEIQVNKNWEFFILTNDNQIAAVLCCYINNKTYSPLIMGIDYLKEEDCSFYKQIMYQVVISAKNRGYKKIFFGFSADTEKKKLGAKQIAKNAFVNIIDHYNLETIDKINL